MSNESVPTMSGRQNALDELRRALDKLESASDMLDNKLAGLLNASSIIVALIGILQLQNLQAKSGWLYWGVLVSVLVLYLALFVIILRGQAPRKHQIPISFEWNAISIRYFNMPESDVLDRLITDHLVVIAGLRSALNQKGNAVQRASILFGVLIVVIFSAFGIGLL